jgi:integrase
VSKQRHERPVKRVNPSGKVVWYARYTDARGRRRSAGTFKTKREAQDAIDAAYGLAPGEETVGGYFAEWPRRRPRGKRTQETNEHRVSRALDIEVEGRLLRDWPLRELRRRHVLVVLDVLLREQRRSARGAMHIVRALGLMAEDAITDDVVDVNPFRGVRVRGNDPRLTKGARPTRVFSYEQMHSFAAAAGQYEPMVRTFADTGLRLGEVLPLRRSDLRDGVLHVVRTAHEGEILEGTKTDHGEASPGRLVPCPPGLLELLRAMPARIDTELLFPTLRGLLWRERNFYRDIWYPARERSGLDVRPHEMRHSYVSHLRAAGVDDADLAAIAGHTVLTMVTHYTHAPGKSFDQVRGVIG